MIEACKQVHRARGKALRILDIACEQGDLSDSLARLGHRVLGLTKDSLRRAGSDAAFLRLDYELEPDWEHRVEQILGGIPDLVVASSPESWEIDPEILVGRLAKWILPGSSLVIGVKDDAAPVSVLQRNWEKLRGADGTARTQAERTKSYWKSLLETHGLAVAEVKDEEWLSNRLAWVGSKKF